MVKSSRNSDPSGPMAMGQYLQAICKLPFMANDREELVWLGKYQTSYRSFVLLCHRPSRAHRSIDTVSRLLRYR
jgi:hypothetical protein